MDSAESGIRQATYPRVGIYPVGSVILLLGLAMMYRGHNTLVYLDRIEHERDRWKRAAEVICTLDLRSENSVADVGCGSGYFALKLSPVVGNGRVLAVDIRMLSLAFLKARALLAGGRNMTIIHGESSDPKLRPESVHAVLIANTYHEFEDIAAQRSRRWTRMQSSKELPRCALSMSSRTRTCPARSIGSDGRIYS